jgi:hypothetical protein
VTRVRKTAWLTLTAAIFAPLIGLHGQQQPAPQYALITAPAPGSNSCSMVQSKASLVQKLGALRASTGQGVPAVGFPNQIALVVTTTDGFAVPSQMGPSASDPLVLLLNFNRGAASSGSGVFVFAVNKSFAKYNGCRVQYQPPSRGSVTIK